MSASLRKEKTIARDQLDRSIARNGSPLPTSNFPNNFTLKKGRRKEENFMNVRIVRRSRSSLGNGRARVGSGSDEGQGGEGDDGDGLHG